MITLKTFVGAENTAEDDSTLYQKAIENGIIKGCNFTKSGDNQINISDGYICFRGRNIQVVSEIHFATLATSGTKQGALYLNLDIENHTKPIELISEIGKTSFTENQLLLATYSATALTISDLTVVCDRILDARKNNIQIVKNSEPKTTDDINKNFIVGDSWVVPNITFNNLIKNGDNVQVSDWVVEPTAKLTKWSEWINGFKLTVTEPMGSYCGAIQNTDVDVVAGHTYFVKFIKMISSNGEYLEIAIKAGNNEIYTKTVNNTSDPNALKVQGIFKAPVGANGKLSFEFGFGNIPSEEGNPIFGDTYVKEITLIDLTQDMTDLYAFDLSQCDSYFFGKTFKTNHYEKSGVYYCLSNIQNNAKWEKTNNDYIVEKVYPVGSIYMSMDSTSPAERFGGTWERIQGRFILGAGAYGIDHNGDSANYPAGMTGGEMRHKLTVAEMAKHNHDLMSGWIGTGGQALQYDVVNFSRSNINQPGYKPGDFFMSKTGDNQPHNNMPPYLAVYMWKRIS